MVEAAQQEKQEGAHPSRRTSFAFAWILLADVMVVGSTMIAVQQIDEVNGWLGNVSGTFRQAATSADGQHVWALLDDQLLYSADAAQTWEETDTGVKEFAVTSDERLLEMTTTRGLVWHVKAGLIDDRQISNSKTLQNLEIAANGTRAWATGTILDDATRRAHHGLLVISESGENHQVAPSPVPLQSGANGLFAFEAGRRLFQFGAGAVWLTDDDGATWRSALAGDILINQIAASKRSLCAVGNGIYRSDDRGSSWQRVTNSVSSASLWDITAVNDDEFWATGNDGVLLKSLDGCRNWTSINTTRNVPFRRVRVADGGRRIYLLGEDRALLFSSDGGASWQQPRRRHALPNWYYFSLVIMGIGFVPFRRRSGARKLPRWEEEDPERGVIGLLKDFHNSIAHLADRGARPPITLTEEADVRDLLFVIVKAIYPDATMEDPAPAHAGRSKRVDIVIPRIETIIELKFVRDKAHGRAVSNELKVDIESYHSHPSCKKLIVLIWDEQRLLHDRPNVVRDLSGPRSKGGHDFGVEVVVQP